MRFYSHEPFETTYYHEQGLADVLARLRDPLDLRDLSPTDPGARGLVIKEMPYQVGDHFPLLASMATAPMVFLIRDPRLNIASRIKKKLEMGDPPMFPLAETGWVLLAAQIEHCRSAGRGFLIVDATDFRQDPAAILPLVFACCRIVYPVDALNWTACVEVEIDNLGGRQRHFYRRALHSTGIKPPVEAIPPLESFPEHGGMRKHVAHCLEIYDALGRAPERIRIPQDV